VREVVRRWGACDGAIEKSREFAGRVLRRAAFAAGERGTMRAVGISISIFVVSVCSVGFGADDVGMWYEVQEVGGGRWEYTYEVVNFSLATGIEEFTVWFDFGNYENLAIETVEPPAGSWDEIVWQPDGVLGDDGGYDALATGLDIGIGESVYGFAVSFDWLGEGEPGSQYFEVVDPLTFETIADGWTVPEPGTVLLFGCGYLFNVRTRRDA
jgi:hypothetical protein